MNITSTTIADYIIGDKTPDSRERYLQLREESKDVIILSLKILALLIAVSGIFAMIFEAKYFSGYTLQVYITRLSATVIAFTVLVLLNSKYGFKYAIELVHILMLTIILSTGYMIYLLPSTLVINSHLLGLIIFTSSLFLSWEVKQQIIIVIYYNLVFGTALILNRAKGDYNPDLLEMLIFIIFLSVVSILVSAMNFRLRMQISEKSLRIQLSEKKFKSIFDNSAEGIFQSTIEGHFLTVNDALVKILGYKSKEELLKSDISKDIYFSLEDRHKLTARLKSDGEVKNYRLNLKRKDGSKVVVRLNDRIVHDEDKSRVYYEGNMQDISEQVIADEKRKQAEALLRKEKEKSDKLAREALQSNIVKGQFLANMSHEIRTPMNGIIGYLSLIEKEAYEDSDEMKQFAVSAKDSADALMDIINNILDLSKIESGKMELMEAPFSLVKVIDDAVSIVSSKAAEKGLCIKINLSAGTPNSLTGDEARLRQIFVNLLSNAIKFTEEGVVAINASSPYAGGNSAVINFEVSDTGVGIAPDKIDSLFQPFSQIDSSPTRRFGGSGLGLAICKEFVAMMGGVIRADSILGKGTSFFFEVRFKIHESDPDKQQVNKVIDFKNVRKNISRKPEVEKKQSGGIKVLLAEDNLVNQKLAAKMLYDAGFEVDVSSSGKEALQKLVNRSYDIILMDIQMPDMDGFMVTSEIRNSGAGYRNIPIIAITAHGMPGYKEKCINAGMNDYISKPVTAEVLVGKINSVLKIKQVPEKNIKSERDNSDILFDFEHLQKVSLGEATFRKDLLNTFIEDASTRIKKLESYIEGFEYNMMVKEAHTIKGAGNSVGAVKLASLALAVEISAKANDIENARTHFRNMVKIMDDTCSVLKDYGFI